MTYKKLGAIIKTPDNQTHLNDYHCLFHYTKYKSYDICMVVPRKMLSFSASVMDNLYRGKYAAQ